MAEGARSRGGALDPHLPVAVAARAHVAHAAAEGAGDVRELLARPVAVSRAASAATTWLSDAEYAHFLSCHSTTEHDSQFKTPLEMSEPGVARPAAAHRRCCSSQLSVVASPVYPTARTVALLYSLRMIMSPLDHCPSSQNAPK